MSEEQMPCYYCDPYAYPWKTPGAVYAVCGRHIHKPDVRVPPHLPPGWEPSWRRGIWA